MVSLNPEAGLKHWGSCQARDKLRTKIPEAGAWLVLIPLVTRWGDPMAILVGRDRRTAAHSVYWTARVVRRYGRHRACS